MDQESSDEEEEMLSDDSGCASNMSEYEIDRVEKFVQPSEIRTLNARTKHCDLQLLYNGWCFNCMHSMHDSYR